MPLALALDLGTTSIAAAAVNRKGKLVGVVRRPNDAGVLGLGADAAEQDPHRLREIAFAVLKELAESLPEAPHCLGITGQMHGMLLTDAARRPLTRLITWQDRRANLRKPDTEYSWLRLRLWELRYANFEPTGCQLAAGYLGSTVALLRDPAAAALYAPFPSEQVHKASVLADWIAAELTEGAIVTDPGNAASTGLFNIPHRAWHLPLLTKLKIPRAWLPDVRESGAVIGRISSAVAAATGLPEGLPVCNAIGDNQAAVLGSVPARNPAIQINVGTGGQINWPVAEFVRVEGMDTRPLPLGRQMLVGAGLSGGDAYAWVNRTVGGWLSAFGAPSDSTTVYTRLNALAAAAPFEAEGLTCEPLFRGTRRAPLARGRFHGITYDNFTPGNVARAVLRGIAAGMYSFYEEAGAWQPTGLTRIIGSGNGLRQNPLLVEAIEATFQRDVWFPVHEEEACFGTALLAGVSTGLWPSLEAAGGRIQLKKVTGT